VTDDLLQLPENDRRDVYEVAAADLGLPSRIVEKDVWICWVLGALFSDPGAMPMAFKGGTSLSKAFGAIDRFSEDIDITVGFEEVNQQLPTSRNKCRDLGNMLRHRVSIHMTSHVAPMLEARFADEFGSFTGLLELKSDEEIIFNYPSCYPMTGDYVFERVKIEFGGRNSIDPQDEIAIRPYLADLDLALDFPSASVRVLSPIRTFWEKATLAHDECNRPEWTHEGERFARHWYDLARLADQDIGRRALTERAVLEDVIRIKSAFYYRATSDYPSCLAGGFQLIPDGARCDRLGHDFDEMVRVGMFSKTPPSFDAITVRLTDLQNEINIQMR
jgi:hypothetical protein